MEKQTPDRMNVTLMQSRAASLATVCSNWPIRMQHLIELCNITITKNTTSHRPHTRHGLAKQCLLDQTSAKAPSKLMSACTAKMVHLTLTLVLSLQHDVMISWECADFSVSYPLLYPQLHVAFKMTWWQLSVSSRVKSSWVMQWKNAIIWYEVQPRCHWWFLNPSDKAPDVTSCQDFPSLKLRTIKKKQGTKTASDKRYRSSRYFWFMQQNKAVRMRAGNTKWVSYEPGNSSSTLNQRLIWKVWFRCDKMKQQLGMKEYTAGPLAAPSTSQSCGFQIWAS